MNAHAHGHYQQVCGRKRAYPTRQEAEQEAQRHGYGLHVYLCPYGSHWHLTRQPQRVRR